MTELVWVRSHVRQLLQDEWEMCRVDIDGDGDVAFRAGTAMCWVTVLASEPVMVRVFAHAVFGVKSSAKLLRELNAFQERALSARASHVHDLVLVSQTIAAAGLTGPVLTQAVDSVAGLASEIGPMLAPMFGGSTPFDVEGGVESSSEGGPF